MTTFSPQDVRGVRRVQRVHPAGGGGGRRRPEAPVVPPRCQRRLVDVQRRAQEDRAGVLQVRAGRPEPARHRARLGRGHQVAQGQGLLKELQAVSCEKENNCWAFRCFVVVGRKSLSK